MKDKRGAETSTILIWMIVAIAGAVIVLIFVSGSFGIFSNIIKKGDIDTTLISQKCNLYTNIVNSGYCTDKIEIAKDKYVNCGYAVKNFGIEIEGDKPKNCNSTEGIEKGATAICNKLKIEETATNYKKIEVNNKTCIKRDEDKAGSDSASQQTVKV